MSLTQRHVMSKCPEELTPAVQLHNPTSMLASNVSLWQSEVNDLASLANKLRHQRSVHVQAAAALSY